MAISLAKTLHQLKLSDKGRLKYDARWHEKGNILELLEDWSSPPHLSHSPKSTIIVNDTQNKPQVENKTAKIPTVLLDSAKDDEEKILDEEILKVSQIEMNIINYENKIKKEIRANIESRMSHMEDFCNQLHKDAVQKLEYFRTNQQREAERQLEREKSIEARRTEELRQKQEEFREHHMIKAKALDQKLETLRKQQAEEVEQKLREMQSRLSIIIHLNQEIKKLCENIIKQVNNCPGKKYLSDQIKSSISMLQNIEGTAQQIEDMAKQKGALPDHIQLIRQLIEQTKTPLNLMLEDMDKANTKFKLEIKSAEKTSPKEQKSIQMVSSNDSALTKKSEKQSSLPDELLEFVAADALKEYNDLQAKRLKILKLCDEFKPDEKKKMRNDLKIAVNTLINTISDVSGMHLRDKIHKLISLLKGNQIEIGTKKISWTGTSHGALFCMDLISSAILKQAQDQISANKKSAFSLAAVAIAIWSNFPEFGDLLLSCFYLKCPCLVPYYIPLMEGESNEEYFKALGYNYKDGEIENQGAFLKRMKGIVIVYAAIIQSEVPPGINKPHPFGPDKGWIWLTRILNLNPLPDVTATAVHEFLEIAGHVLFKNYGKQFQKVLYILCRDFMSKLDKVTEGQSGPVTRLQTFLQDCVQRRGGIRPADGVLTTYFWNSR